MLSVADDIMQKGVQGLIMVLIVQHRGAEREMIEHINCHVM